MSYNIPDELPERISARFFVSSVLEAGNWDGIRVELTPAYSEGQNKQWAEATPSGKIELSISNAMPAADFFRSLLRDKERNVGIEFFAVPRGE